MKVDDLAQEIRRVDGDNKLGAGALAEAILPFVDKHLPGISLDGPHKPDQHRVWLARQLLDSKLDDKEAYSIVCYSPAVSNLWEKRK